VRLGFSVAQRELGIAPLMTAEEMCSAEEPDSLSMVMYLSQFYQLLRETLPPGGYPTRNRAQVSMDECKCCILYFLSNKSNQE
jgi:hypothetical protein